MMILHTGKLTADIAGQRCSFNGDAWITPDPDVTRMLNRATEELPKQHWTILDRAKHALAKCGLNKTATILEWNSDSSNERLPKGAID